MSKPMLSERLKHFRIDRPSEWLMDDFIRQAEQLEAENVEIRRQHAQMSLWKDQLEADNKNLVKASNEMSDQAQKYAAELEATIEPDCEWTQEDSDWNEWLASCGYQWVFQEGGPKENRMHYCPSCGGKLIALEQKT